MNSCDKIVDNQVIKLGFPVLTANRNWLHVTQIVNILFLPRNRLKSTSNAIVGFNYGTVVKGSVAGEG